MKSKTFKELLYIARNEHDKDAMQELIERFMPSIKKNARILGYDDAEGDLVLHLIEVVYALKNEKIEALSEGQAVNYVVSVIKNRSIDLGRKKCKCLDEVELFETVDKADDYIYNFEINELMAVLTVRQKSVLVLKYYYGYSDVEIGKFLGITRQAVNKIHRVSINKIKMSNRD